MVNMSYLVILSNTLYNSMCHDRVAIEQNGLLKQIHMIFCFYYTLALTDEGITWVEKKGTN